MKFDPKSRTIFLTRHGSHAYGTNIETSDEDFKGVCIEPTSYHYGFLNKFEQFENINNPNDLNNDTVIYSLKKFAKLAADCNPNIIEVLWADDSDIVKIDSFGQRLRDARDLFLSKNVKFTFSGYAHAQLKRIKSHRSWLLNPPQSPPSRKEFGLPDERLISKSELGAFNALNTEFLPNHVVSLFVKEKQYQSKVLQFKQYENWKRSRNTSRAKLEAKSGYDTKHGMHLIRLMRMCKEILNGQGVIVKRPDFEELLSIRRGERSYDDLIDEAERIESECDLLYTTSLLPKESNRNLIDDLIVDITQEYLSQNG